MLEAAKAAMAGRSGDVFLVAQHGAGGSALARTVHLEHPGLKCRVVDVPAEDERAIGWVVDEAAADGAFCEARYTPDGRRQQPVMRGLHWPIADAAPPLTSDDVLLVTGGGKGIAAECALELTRRWGCRLALLGRSDPSRDAELGRNLDRFAAAGVRFRYLAADIRDAQAVRRAIGEAQDSLGPVTAFLHGAGVNTPKPIQALDVPSFTATLAPKVVGARNVLSAVDPGRLRLVVAFGSLIARTGMRGEADYAVGNDWLGALVEEWAVAHPHCRCLTLEWSVWSGVGMGERLGRIEALAREGISAITPEQGVRAVGELLGATLPATRVVVTGRFGEPAAMAGAGLPFLRFLERPIVHYPGIELVAEATLTADTDPYLRDHALDGQQLFPAVMGLEAMAQAATALMPPGARLSGFEEVVFARPIQLGLDGRVRVRVAALVRGPGSVEAVVRSEETGFQFDHFRAVCRFDANAALPAEAGAAAPGRADLPAEDVYDRLLFHSGRFRRLAGYSRLTAYECAGEIDPPVGQAWFARHLPGETILGDAGGRDAALHALQACIPQARVLPIGVDLLLADSSAQPDRRWFEARQLEQQGDILTFDLQVRDGSGRVVERWEGLRLKILQPIAADGAWPPHLLGPYLQREAARWLQDTVAEIESPREDVVGGSRVSGLRHRPDGKPVLMDGRFIARSNGTVFRMTVTGRRPVGCDVEEVEPRPAADWGRLLGGPRMDLAALASRESGEGLDAAATRVWCLGECLKKAGLAADLPLVLDAVEAGGWIRFRGASLSAVTFACSVRGLPRPLVFALLGTTRDVGL
jgi:enediyne polyketide synthase